MSTRSLVFCLLLPIRLLSQSWGWNYTVTPYSHGQIYNDNIGNVYAHGVATWVNGWVNDSVFSKYAPNGSPLWNIHYPAHVRITAAACASDTFVYVLGQFDGTMTLGSSTLVSRGSTDIFLHKLTASGVTMWITSIGSKTADIAGDVCCDGTNVVVCGAAGDSTYLSNVLWAKDNFRSLFIARFDANGAYLGACFAEHQALQSSSPWDYSMGCEIERDPSGNFAVIAAIDGCFKVDTAQISHHSGIGIDETIIKFSPSFQLLWVSPFTSYLQDMHDLVINSQGELFFLVENCGHHSPCGDRLYRMFPNGILYGTFQGFGGWSGINTPFSNVINGLTIDSCDNIYFTGCSFVFTYSAGTTDYSLTVGQLSPTALQLNWLISDTAIQFQSGYSIVSLGVNKCVVNGGWPKYAGTGTVLSTYAQFLSLLQATVGLPVSVTPPQQLAICGPASAVLTATSAGLVSWYQSPGSSTALAVGSTYTSVPLPPGTYTFYAEASTCSMTTGRLPITVTVNPNPTVAASTGTVCPKATYTIQLSGAQAYTISGGSAAVSPSVSTVYTITGANAAGCTHSAMCSVFVMPLPNVSILTNKNFLCRGDAATLTAQGAVNYAWTGGPGTGSCVVSPTAHTYYYVSGTDVHGCVNTASITQFVAECVGLNSADEATLRVYPNPATEWLHVDCKAPMVIRIVDCSGRLIMEATVSPGESVDLASVKEGIYFVTDEKSRTLGKFSRINN
jgi:hypothetical protein